MKDKPVVLVDMDGVLADFDLFFHQTCVENGWELDTEHHNRTERWYCDHLPIKWQSNASRKLIDTPGWFLNLPVIKGAQEGMRELRKHAEVWICTKPLEANIECSTEKMKWLKQHFPKHTDKVIFAPDKSLILGDILLDDAIKLKWLPRAKWQPVVYTQPFNGNHSEWKDFVHFDWDDPIEYLVELAYSAQRGEEL